MAAPIKNNLPPASQQWVRDIERRMADLERENQLLQATTNRNATQIGAIQSALSNSVPIAVPIPPSAPITVTNSSGSIATQVGSAPYTKFHGQPASIFLVTTILAEDTTLGATLGGRIATSFSAPPYGIALLEYGFTPLVTTPLTLGSDDYISEVRQKGITMPLTGQELKFSQTLQYTVTGTATLSISGFALVFPATSVTESN